VRLVRATKSLRVGEVRRERDGGEAATVTKSGEKPSPEERETERVTKGEDRPRSGGEGEREGVLVG
jgi:hypothetical protein